MSKSLHGGYSGTHGSDDNHRNFADNLPELTKKYPLSPGGYFGTKGHGEARHIVSDDPLKTAMDFYSKATKGAKIKKPLGNDNPNSKPRAEYAIMKDNSRIQIRPISHSSDGSPAVDICIVRTGNVKKQKIHFVKGDNK